jgi:hypothetical protein
MYWDGWSVQFDELELEVECIVGVELEVGIDIRFEEAGLQEVDHLRGEVDIDCIVQVGKHVDIVDIVGSIVADIVGCKQFDGCIVDCNNWD